MRPASVKLTPEQAILEDLWEGYPVWFKTPGGRLAQVEMRRNRNMDEVFTIRFYIQAKPVARLISRQTFVDFDEVMSTLKKRRYSEAYQYPRQ